MLRDIVVDRKEVKEMLEKLEVNKTSGRDGVSNWIWRECSKQLADKIQKLIAKSLEMGKVPYDWKRANIVQIYKGRNKEELVSLTSVVVKLCETVVKDK